MRKNATNANCAKRMLLVNHISMCFEASTSQKVKPSKFKKALMHNLLLSTQLVGFPDFLMMMWISTTAWLSDDVDDGDDKTNE